MNLAHDERVHFVQVIEDLMAAGLSLRTIGLRIGCNGKRVEQWLRISCQPRHDDGVRLVNLWASTMQQPADKVHVINHYDWRA